jgi:hypothetical protein
MREVTSRKYPWKLAHLSYLKRGFDEPDIKKLQSAADPTSS